MSEHKDTREGAAAPGPTDAPTQADVNAAIAAENDAARNAQEAALAEADNKERTVHGVTVTRGDHG